jgi:hypothetical protein
MPLNLSSFCAFLWLAEVWRFCGPCQIVTPDLQKYFSRKDAKDAKAQRKALETRQRFAAFASSFAPLCETPLGTVVAKCHIELSGKEN